MNKIAEIGPWKIKTMLWSKLPGDTKYLKQTHGSVIVDENEIRNGLTEADGIFTRLDSHPVAIRTADCLPMVITTSNTAFVIHISRKTLIAGILDQIDENLDITGIYLGPHICATCFTFDYEGEEITKFKNMFPQAVTQNTSIHLSVSQAVQSYLTKWGIPAEKIIVDTRCTYESKDLPSYRRSLETNTKLNDHIATIVSS